MRSFTPLVLAVIVIIIAAFGIESTNAMSRVDRSSHWFKPSPEVRSPNSQFRSRFTATRLLPRRMYRSMPMEQLDAYPALNDITNNEEPVMEMD
ncbi:unnamed protein product [Caenorhabditis bovis]|uniref:Uncharacterized protein n=1 Tax=Caenorhabditis bovis TaxID=2654633 RepID=A0A8S1E912_9PELO|nr:unnamed protein product [Caenorhabditis bovis]